DRRRERLMRLVSFERNGTTGFGIAVGEGIVDLGARFAGRASSLKTLLEADLVAEAARHAGAAADHALEDVRLRPTVPNPGKIICIGINYRNRDREYGDAPADEPKYPSVFFRTPESLVAHGEPIV